MFQREFNPLLARRRSRRVVTLSLLAGLGLVTTGAFAVSASTAAAPKEQTQTVSRTVEATRTGVAQAESATISAPQRRQVRVIPLFKTPANPTGK